MLEEEFDFIMEVLESELRPYRDSYHVYRKLPEKGKAHEDILTEMNELAVRERAKWHSGYVSGAVYNGDAFFGSCPITVCPHSQHDALRSTGGYGTTNA